MRHDPVTPGAQAVYVALIHGVAVWPDGGGLKVLPVAAPLPPDGMEYLRRHKAEIIKAFSEIGAAQIMRLHLREYGRRLGGELVNEYRAIVADRKPSISEFMQAWAHVLYCDVLRSWPE